MSRTQRLSLALLLVAPACSDDVSSEEDTDTSSTTEPTSTSGETQGTSLSTTIDPSTSGEPSSTTMTDETDTIDPDSSSSTSDSTTMTDDTSTGTTDDTSSTGSDSSSSTGGAMCGDDLIEGREDCDGTELGAETCESQGFVSGDLACADDCTYDTSGCETCGDGVVDVGDACDGDDLGGASCDSLGMGFTGGTLGCAVDCSYDTSGCTSFVAPGTGEVLVTEIMQNPNALLDSDGEWFEVHNPSDAATYQLGSCTIEGSDSDNGFTIEGDLEIEPGGYLVFSVQSDADQGFTADYQWPTADFNLSNSADTVTLDCDGMVVDTVAYDNGATFPDPTGASMSLDPASTDAAANDIGGNWCEGQSSYNGDLGTPGAANEACPVEVTYDIGFCRLQFPETIEELEGSDVDVFGRVFVAGLTDISGTNDVAPEVIGYVGYGPDGTDPAVDAGWVWAAGSANGSYGPASPNYEANNDEYQATLSVPAAGEYDFAFRFSGDTGATFTYCDGGAAGSSDGYAAADAGQMTSGEVSVSGLYFSEYVEGSSNNKALEVYNSSVDAVDLDLCEVRIYANGNTSPSNTISLTGMLPAADVYVLCDDSFDDTMTDLCDLLDGGSWFNGDDAVELVCGADTLDVIGQIGTDPGTEWSGGGVGTQNETIRRDCDAGADPDGSDAFDPSIQWTTFAQDEFSDLGQYICD